MRKRGPFTEKIEHFGNPVLLASGEWMTKQADDYDNPYSNRGMLSLKD